MITIVAARNLNDVMAKKGVGIPWHHKEDLAFFREYTMNKVVVMGHTTYETMPKPLLPGRKVIVLSSNEHLGLNDAEVYNNYMDLVQKYKTSREELIIAGGAQIYNLFMSYADRIVLSRIPNEEEGDLYFNDPDEEVWKSKSTIILPTFAIDKYERE